MNITVTGRHLNVSDNLRDYAEKKIKKLEKYFNQLIDAHVILSSEKLDRISEVVINGDGVQFHGKEKAADLHSAIDLLFEKMEKQIRRYKEKHQSHKGPNKGDVPAIDVTSNGGMEIILRQVSNKPVDNIEAFLQMRIDKKDFILFKKGFHKIEPEPDYPHKNYAVIYQDNLGLKMIEIPHEKAGSSVPGDHFVEYNINVVEESPVNPKIEFKKSKNCDLKKLTLHEAIVAIDESSHRFLPFFNIESQFINVIYKSGGKYEVMVPVF